MRGRKSTTLPWLVEAIKNHNSDECLPWPFTQFRGHGICRYEGAQESVHRVAFHLANGHWPVGRTTHSCGDSLCVNPRHVIERDKANIGMTTKRQKSREQMLEEHAQYARIWYHKNRDKCRASMRKFSIANKARLAQRVRLIKYGINQSQFEAMLKSQNYLCACCDEPLKRSHIDHDHSCCRGKAKSCGRCIRGILCSRCNCGLGNFDDDPDLLLKAAAYVSGWQRANY